MEQDGFAQNPGKKMSNIKQQAYENNRTPTSVHPHAVIGFQLKQKINNNPI
ncbi:hypothetical protein [Flavobacterium caeni]|uniref:Uncharacterized protein n=1 Tax=Flavobacterium caeni TaxID=490189 RepID=A0A1G5HU81_9FLAO|nr:hypothetical protein [Flavobacterium caeni]SCY67251.1 hypothetical protein SAMN02927903_02007 [Flavobacterium caeni]